MTSITENPHAGGFILSEANGKRSRENVTIVQGEGALPAGTVLGKITGSGKYRAYDNNGTDGSETAAAILIHPVDATDADVDAAVIARDAEVNQHELVWADDNNTSDIEAGIADLENVGIIVR